MALLSVSLPECKSSMPKNRKYERFLISQHLDCQVRLNGIQRHLLQLCDISEGGMMVLISSPEDLGVFSPPEDIAGEIVSDNTALQMAFSGKIVWKRNFTESGRAFCSMGIQFAAGVKLPDAIGEMLSSETD